MFYDQRRFWSIRGHKDVSLFIFYAVTKRTKNRDNEQKFNQNLRANAVEAVKPYFAPQKCSIKPSSNADNVICDFSLMRIGNKSTKKREKGKIN